MKGNENGKKGKKGRAPQGQHHAVDSVKQDLLADSDEEGKAGRRDESIKINKAFAERYEQRKRKELLSKHKELLEELSEESTSEEEDEDGALLTPQVEKKLLKVLSLIRRKDAKIYNPNKVFFKDSDFEREDQKEEEAAKPMRYRDVMRRTLTEEGASAFVDEDEEVERQRHKTTEPTYHEELASLKKSFLEAAEAAEAEDGGLLQMKTKGREDEEQEEREYKQFLDSKGAHKHADSEAVLARFWTDDESLDAGERFLRDYILNQAWREDKAIPAWQAASGVDDEEDCRQLEEAEAFEASYNFRFEEEGGCEIQGHPRVVADSVRQVDDKRKRARERKSQQKQEEQIRRQEELKRLKSLKRDEITAKIKHIQEVGGLDDATVKSVLNLDADFDPEAHDAEMQQLFGKEYDAEQEGRSCLEMPESCADILSTAHETTAETLTKKQRKLLKLQKKRQRQNEAVEGYAEEDTQHQDAVKPEQRERRTDAGCRNGEQPEGDEATQAEWWMCDACGKGIRGGKKRFDCTTCDNFTLCKVCFRNVRHPHQLVRRTVPLHCSPPKDFEMAAPTSEASAELSDLLDEYFQLDYEDIIGGDLPTRFKYRKVEPGNYGLTTEEILNSTDAELNSKVSLKKLAPYREQEKGDNTASKPWFQQRRNKYDEGYHADSKMKRRDRTERTMTPFGVRQDRLKAYDA